MILGDAAALGYPSRMRALLLLLLLTLPLGCAVERYSLATLPRTAIPLAGEVQARFDYAHVGSAALTQRWEDEEVTIHEGKLHIAVSGWDEPQEVEFEYWRGKHAAEPAPLLLVTPILGGGQELARNNCRDFVREGLHVLLVWRGTRILRDHWTLADPERYLRKAVAGRRALLDWAQARPEVDERRMCAFGISMGGILTSALMAAEPRLHSGVIALAGGDLAGIIRHSTEGRLVKYRASKMEELALDPAAFEDQLRELLPSDPLELAGAVDPRRVLMVTGRYDDVVPLRYQRRLWEGLGRPTRYDLPSGHYSGILYLPYVTRVVSRWLHARLRSAGALPSDGEAAGS